MRYHLTLSLRHWSRRVHTVALWLVRPDKAQRRGLLRHGSIEVQVTPIVLRDVDAATLLATPETACFALGAGDGGRGDDAVCMDAVRLLRESGASLRRFQFAAAAARSHSKRRFRAMVKAMNAQGVEAVIIEDLVKIGEELGLEKGIRKGRKQGRKQGLEEGLAEARKALVDICELLGVSLDDERRAAIEAMDLPQLEALRLKLKSTRSW